MIHLATAAVVNAVWDLYAKVEGKPLWRLLADMTPEEIVRAIDFRYITDALRPDEAPAILQEKRATKGQRIEELERDGFPAYTTSAGWLGYDDEKLRAALPRSASPMGGPASRIKVGRDLEDDIRRCRIIREEIGWDRRLMMDANQVWDVEQAVAWMENLAEFKPWFIEEPTSPDDVLGHAAIADAVAPILVATGEHCANRVMFKQFLQAGRDRRLPDRLVPDRRRQRDPGGDADGGQVRRAGLPACRGVGLCEYVQHLSMFDYVAISGSMEDRLTEYAAHLHEHFLAPVVLRDGRYMPPTAPGYSIEMKPDSITDYTFPTGTRWRV